MITRMQQEPKAQAVPPANAPADSVLSQHSCHSRLHLPLLCLIIKTAEKLKDITRAVAEYIVMDMA